MAKVLLLEPEITLKDSIRSHLELLDYIVSTGNNIDDLTAQIDRDTPDILVIHTGPGEHNSFSFVKELRKTSSLPVIILSDSEKESSLITGFEVGCDDFIKSPLSTKELALRIGAILRRTGVKKEKKPVDRWTLEEDIINVDHRAHRLSINGKSANLTASQWKIFLCLTEGEGAVVSRGQIIDRCLDYAFEGYDRTVDTHIKKLRANLGSPKWIETVRGYGYRFAGETNEEEKKEKP